MACDVDELDVNPFFRALQTRFSDLYNRAQERCYTICIPQSSSIQDSSINKDFAETHILKPSPYFKGELLTSHGSTGKAVTLSDDSYTLTTGQGFQRELKVKVVSEELAYNKDYKQYRILILDQPLDPKFHVTDKQAGGNNGSNGRGGSPSCVTVAECEEFLHSFPDFSKALEKVNHAVESFNTSYMVLPDYLPEAAARLSDISSEAVESCIKSAGRKKAADVQWREALESAMESYVMSRVHKKVFAVLSQRFAADDASVERKCRQQLKGISQEALGIQQCFVCPLLEAIRECNKLHQLKTPREKLHCLKSVIDAVNCDLVRHLSRDLPPHLMAEQPHLTSDDLIPTLVYVMGQSNCQQLQSDIMYMETFTWASSAKDLDNLSYCLVTFKAAVQYIINTDFSSLPQKASSRKQDSNVQRGVHIDGPPLSKTLHGKQVGQDKLSSSVAHLSIYNGGGKGDKSPSPCVSPTPFSSIGTGTATGSDRVERQMSRITRALDETSRTQTREPKEQTVKSIFGDQYQVPTLKTATKSQDCQPLGDFLSSLQDDFMDQPFGKQA